MAKRQSGRGSGKSDRAAGSAKPRGDKPVAATPPSTPVESFAYDTDGNLTGDGGKVPGASRPDGTPRKFTWDGENRLIRVEPADGYSPVSGDVKVEFRYDYLGRRVEKKVSTHDGSSWAVTDTRRFLWYNWLMLLELNGDNDILKKYTWGLDLAGLSGQVNSLESAGGIGGLLACYDTAGTSGTGDDKSYAYMFDGNGNVGQLIDVADGSLDAHYEYDAYGNAVVAIGSYGQSNALRFSTKQFGAESGLYYFGYRYYNTRGTWTSRDPLQERGSLHLYTYCSNRPNSSIDALGLSDRNSIIKGDLVYSCNCGWIDWNHAQPTVAADLLQRVRSGAGLKSARCPGGVLIGVSLPAGGTWPNLVNKEYCIKSPLAPCDPAWVALAIWRDISREYESTQAFWFSSSGWSEEDLNSNLIGFYMALNGYTRADIEELCGVLDLNASLDIWDQFLPMGLGKSRVWGFPQHYRTCYCCDDSLAPGGLWPEALRTNPSPHDLPQNDCWWTPPPVESSLPLETLP